MALDERARRRPGAHVPGDVVERQGLLDHEVGCGEFSERKLDGLVTLLRDSPFRRPIGTHDVAVEAAHDLVDLRCDLEHHIRPHRDHTVWPKDTPNLGPKSGAVEPVQRLRHRDEIDRSVAEVRGLGRTDAVLDARIVRGVVDLAAAGVGRDDEREVSGQPDRGLARAGACVPRFVARRRGLRQEVEQRIRVAGPEGRIVGGGGGGGGAGANGGVTRCASRHSGHAPG